MFASLSKSSDPATDETTVSGQSTTTSAGWSKPEPDCDPIANTRRPANPQTTTTSACSVRAHDGRPSSHDDFSLCLDCPERPTAQPPQLRPGQNCSSQPSAQPPRLPPMRRLTIASVCATTPASACAAASRQGRLPNHCDFRLCWDCLWRPSVQPPWLRPVVLLLITAVRATTTTSACVAAASSGRPRSHHGFGHLQQPTARRCRAALAHCFPSETRGAERIRLLP